MLPFQDDTAVIRSAEITTTALGERQRDWTNAATSTTVRCNVQPDGTTETRAAGTRNQVVSTFRFWFPPATQVSEHDRIIWHGTTLDVTGRPQRWVVDGTEHHIEVVATTSIG